MNPSTHAGKQSCFNRISLVFIVLVAILGMLPEWTRAQLPTGYDQRPRLDVAGNIVDAHEGMVTKFGNTYYLYGTSYEHTSGYDFIGYTNHYRCYTSTDLKTWTLAADHLLKKSVNGVLVDPPEGIYYLPKVLYNAQNNNYVLWYNWWTRLGVTASLGVAVSSSPQGPFVIVNHCAVQGSYDMSIAVVDDPQSPYNQNAYMMYTVFSGFNSYVQKLSPDYLSLTGSAKWLKSGEEACVLFYNNVYHRFYALLGSGLCQFCTAGQSSDVWESPDARTTDPTSSAIWPQQASFNLGPQIPGQQFHVATISTPQGNKFLWMADLWGTGPNWVVIPPLDDRGEDQQFWAELQFDANGHITDFPAQTYTRSLVLRNGSYLTWTNPAQIVAYAPDGTHLTPWTITTPWSPGAQQSFSIDTAGFANSTAYTIEFQDLSSGTPTLVSRQLYMNSSALDAGVDPWVFQNKCGSISGYIYYCNGWNVTWDGQPANSTATMSVTNLSNIYSTDPLQLVAHLQNVSSPKVGSPIVVGYIGTWAPGQVWTVSLSALTAGYPYIFEIQDRAYGNVVIDQSSPVLQLPASGQANGGWTEYTGTGGYFGWHTHWTCGQGSLTLTNNSNSSMNDTLQIVAYNADGTSAAVWQSTAALAAGSTWTVSLAALTPGNRYYFRLQDHSFGDALFPPESRPPTLQLPSGAGLTGYIYNSGTGGYNGWHTHWNWEYSEPGENYTVPCP